MLAQGIPHQPMVSPSCFFVLLRIDEIWDDPPICILKEGYWKTVIPSLQLHIPLIVFLCAVAFTNNHSKLTTAHTTHCVSLCCCVYKQSFQAYNCTYHSLCFFVLLSLQTVIPSLQLHIPLIVFLCAVALKNSHPKLTTAHTTHCVSLCCCVEKQSSQAYNCTYHSHLMSRPSSWGSWI